MGFAIAAECAKATDEIDIHSAGPVPGGNSAGGLYSLDNESVENCSFTSAQRPHRDQPRGASASIRDVLGGWVQRHTLISVEKMRIGTFASKSCVKRFSPFSGEAAAGSF